MITFLDFETQSAADLRLIGGRAYLRHKSTRVMSLVMLQDKTIYLYVNPKAAPEGYTPTLAISNGHSLSIINNKQLCGYAGQEFAAHNAMGFDKPCWEIFVRKSPEDKWVDTAPACRAAGLPAGLDTVCRYLFGRGKHDGSKAMKILSRARKVVNGKPVFNVGTAALWDMMLDYNVQDVLMLRDLHAAVCPAYEQELLEVDQKINDRGFHVDRNMVEKLQTIWFHHDNAIKERIEKMTGGDITTDEVQSPIRVRKWLATQGISLDSLERKHVDMFLNNPEEWPDETEQTAVALEVLRLRQRAMRTSKAKLQTLLDQLPADNRLRGAVVYHGAHTGRWSGRGLQPHNLPRGGSFDSERLCDGDLSEARIAAVAGAMPLDEAMVSLIRPCFTASAGRLLGIVDYAVIEARGVAWLAGEESLLERFRNHDDVYLEMASRIYGRTCTKADVAERKVGKETVLGCGYSMSAKKFEAYCKIRGIDLGGTSPEACVEAYRDMCPNIAGVKSGKFWRGGLWNDLHTAARNVLEVEGVSEVFCQGNNLVSFRKDPRGLIAVLPSNREIVYRNARIAMRVPPYCKMLGLPEKEKPTIVYDSPRGHEASLYGGLLTENIVQGICRDILAEALIRCEKAGLRPVMHVHDEIICEFPAKRAAACLEKQVKLMTKVPEWAVGFPIAAEGFTNPRYTKSPWSTSHVYSN